MGGGFGAPGAQNGIQFSFGIGAFPFTFLSAVSFNFVLFVCLCFSVFL